MQHDSKLFSLCESELFDTAIREKIALINSLKKKINGQQNMKLSELDNRKTVEHCEKKIIFFIFKNKTKRKDWSTNITKKSKTKKCKE